MEVKYTLLDVTIGHVIHKLVQHISTEGGSEKEVNLSFKFYSIKVCNLCYLASLYRSHMPYYMFENTFGYFLITKRET